MISAITLNQGNTSAQAAITAKDDDLAELDESGTLLLQVDEGFAETEAQLRLSIPANDIPVINITPTNITLAEGDSATLTITVFPSPLADEALRIEISAEGDDIIIIEPSTVALTMEKLQATVEVEAVDDRDKEPEELMTIKLMLQDESSVFAELGDGQVLVTIPANDSGLLLKIKVYLEGALE